MESGNISLEKVLGSAKLLSTNDKIKLIKRISNQIEQELKTNSSKPQRSLRGLWRGQTVSDKDIAEVRKELWGSFPREDI